jgi:maleylpyruvate isomerase
MFKTAAHLPGDLNRLGRETDMLLATVDSFADEEFAVPSKRDGWTRAHVVAHLAAGADAMSNLIAWSTTGVETPAYASRAARDAGIDALAAKPPAELKAALHTAAKNFAQRAAALAHDVKVQTVTTSDGTAITPYALPAWRIAEVVVHHDDLDTVWGLEEADIDALEDSLEVVVERASTMADFPGLTIETDERDSYVIGDGATTVKGGRDAVIGWLASGSTDGLRHQHELPELPPRPLC